MHEHEVIPVPLASVPLLPAALLVPDPFESDPLVSMQCIWYLDPLYRNLPLNSYGLLVLNTTAFRRHETRRKKMLKTSPGDAKKCWNTNHKDQNLRFCCDLNMIS